MSTARYRWMGTFNDPTWTSPDQVYGPELFRTLAEAEQALIARYRLGNTVPTPALNGTTGALDVKLWPNTSYLAYIELFKFDVHGKAVTFEGWKHLEWTPAILAIREPNHVLWLNRNHTATMGSEAEHRAELDARTERLNAYQNGDLL